MDQIGFRHDGGPLRGAEFLQSDHERYIKPMLGLMKQHKVEKVTVAIWSDMEEGGEVLDRLSAKREGDDITFEALP